MAGVAQAGKPGASDQASVQLKFATDAQALPADAERVDLLEQLDAPLFRTIGRPVRAMLP